MDSSFNNIFITAPMMMLASYSIRWKIVVVVESMIRIVSKYYLKVLPTIHNTIKSHPRLLPVWDGIFTMFSLLNKYFDIISKVATPTIAFLVRPVQNYDVVFKAWTVLTSWGPLFQVIFTPGFILVTLVCYSLAINPFEYLPDVIRYIAKVFTFFVKRREDPVVVPAAPIENAVNNETGYWARSLAYWFGGDDIQPVAHLINPLDYNRAFLQNVDERAVKMLYRNLFWKKYMQNNGHYHPAYNPIVKTYNWTVHHRDM